jgi:tetratricopeptide (TPR) repeat protein
MRLPRLKMRRWVVALWLAVLVGIFAVWLIRPGPTRVWLGLDGLGEESPLSVLHGWVADRHKPLTPIGCLSLFPAVDLALAGSLVTAIVIQLVVMAAPSEIGQGGFWLMQPAGALRFPRVVFRVRSGLLLIAILGLALGWEIVAWRNWQAGNRYREQAKRFATSERRTRWSIQRHEEILSSLMADKWPFLGDTTTPAAQAAEKAYQRDRIQRHLVFLYADANRAAQLTRQYEAAADNPSMLVPADPPPPKVPMEPSDWLAWKDYDRALAGFDELVRQYPDYADAHQRRAFILAACPDAKLRNGTEAIASATRACELTTWRDPIAVSTLAAAFAEVGDFPAAIRHEQNAQSLLATGGRHLPPGEWQADRMTAYKASKPYRAPK